MSVRVECYSGHRGSERPRVFEMDGRRVAVEEILDQWQGTDHRYFKLRGDDGNLYILRHDQGADAWEMTLYQSPRGAAISGSLPEYPESARRRGKPH